MLSCKGKNYLVVAREDLSGWVEAQALASANSAAVAKCDGSSHVRSNHCLRPALKPPTASAKPGADRQLVYIARPPPLRSSPSSP
jgi:hypothetical protein